LSFISETNSGAGGLLTSMLAYSSGIHIQHNNRLFSQQIIIVQMQGRFYHRAGVSVKGSNWKRKIRDFELFTKRQWGRVRKLFWF